MWTGTELIIRGGTDGTTDFRDGAAYDPQHDRWRLLPAGGPESSAAPVAAWTGDTMIVIDGSYQSPSPAGAAAYDPSTDTWRSLAAPAGPVIGSSSAAWLDGSVYVLGIERPVAIVSTAPKLAVLAQPSDPEWSLTHPVAHVDLDNDTLYVYVVDGGPFSQGSTPPPCPHRDPTALTTRAAGRRHRIHDRSPPAPPQPDGSRSTHGRPTTSAPPCGSLAATQEARSHPNPSAIREELHAADTQLAVTPHPWCSSV